MSLVHIPILGSTYLSISFLLLKTVDLFAQSGLLCRPIGSTVAKTVFSCFYLLLYALHVYLSYQFVFNWISNFFRIKLVLQNTTTTYWLKQCKLKRWWLSDISLHFYWHITALLFCNWSYPTYVTTATRIGALFWKCESSLVLLLVWF